MPPRVMPIVARSRDPRPRVCAVPLFCQPTISPRPSPPTTRLRGNVRLLPFRHGLRNLLIDNISPLMNVAIGCAYYRLAPWAANLLLMVGMDKGNPLHNVAFFATTDVMHALPTMPLCNSAIHRILDEKPVQGVCVRLRSGPETVSRCDPT